jgi:hypothetical protein
VTSWLSGSSSKAVDLPAVALRRAAGSAVTDGEQWAKRILFRWWRTAIVKAVDGERSTDPLGDQLSHVDDPLALVDACLDVIAHLDRGGWFRCRVVDPHMTATAGRGCIRPGLRDSDGSQPLVNTH